MSREQYLPAFVVVMVEIVLAPGGTATPAAPVAEAVIVAVTAEPPWR